MLKWVFVFIETSIMEKCLVQQNSPWGQIPDSRLPARYYPFCKQGWVWIDKIYAEYFSWISILGSETVYFREKCNYQDDEL